jgi:F-type H+-transporting ATPase subunit gamma
MEVVSATKMRKSQDLALRARPYAFAAFELLAAASKKMKAGEKLPALLMENNSKKTLAIIIASDKGLAGSLNANVLRKAFGLFGVAAASPLSSRSTHSGTMGPADGSRVVARDDKQKQGNEGGTDLVTVGKKGKEYFAYRGFSIVKEFVGHGDFVDIAEMSELHDFISEQFLTGVYGKVVFVYTNFLSTLRQEPVVRQVLPILRENLHEMIEGLIPEKGKYSDMQVKDSVEREPYLFEPSREEVLKELSDRLFKMELYHIQLESNASEHSARMVAMKTASENAEEIVDDLTLVYNKGRQAKITQEIMEITSGSDAVG